MRHRQRRDRLMSRNIHLEHGHYKPAGPERVEQAFLEPVRLALHGIEQDSINRLAADDPLLEGICASLISRRKYFVSCASRRLQSSYRTDRSQLAASSAHQDPN